MISKTTLALAVAGFVTATAKQATPVIPRWISADKHGYGYILTSYWNGTYNYEGSTSFSWDFDYNCVRSYAYSYSDYQWAESSYCNNVVTEYHSLYGCSQQNVGYISLEKEMNDWVDDFTISWGTGFTDPVWGYDNYHVLEHKSDWAYIYMRPSDNAIEFIVDASGGNYDMVAYFPSGLTVDNTTYGVYDFELRYGQCANNATFGLFKSLRSFKAKPALEKPADLAKPRPQVLASVGGVRSLFKSKPKAMVALPDKATFALNKQAAVAGESPFKLFKNVAAPKTGKVQSLLAGDSKMAKVKAFVATLKSKDSTYDEQLEKEVDMIFMMADSNFDGFITKAELKAAIIASGEQVNEAELNFVFAYIDANADGKISRQELINFAKSFNQQLYTREQKTDIIFMYYDTNSDGYLNKSEIKTLLKDAQGHASDADVEWFLAVVDSDWDGKISWYELYAIVE